VHNLSGAEAFIKSWDDEFSGFTGWSDKVYSKKAKILLSFLFMSGVVRDSRKQIDVARDTCRYYSAEDGNLLEPGTEAFIKQPFWVLNGNVLEKGIISIKK